jgi:phage gpG-like protein
MAEAFTSYTVDNDNKFRNAIKKASEVSQDLRVPFGLILRDFYKSEQAIWKLKGPGKYPPFKGPKDPKTGLTKYQARKRKDVGFDYPLLVRTGSLAASLSGPNNNGSISKITKLSLVFGTSIKYGVYHQSDEPRSKIPLRKFLFIGPEAPTFATSEQQGRLERWQGYMTDHIAAQIRKAGLSG